MSVNYGSKRVVVGAHYGLRDWIAQRVTGVLMVLFTLAVLGQVLLTSGDISYDKWAGIFSLYRFGHPRVGGRSRHLDGLRQGRWPAFGSTSIHFGLAGVLSRLGHSGSLEALSHDS